MHWVQIKTGCRNSVKYRNISGEIKMQENGRMREGARLGGVSRRDTVWGWSQV